MTLHGTFKVSSASMYESVPDTATEPMDVDNTEAANQEGNKEDKPADEVKCFFSSNIVFYNFWILIKEEDDFAPPKEEKKEKKKTIATELPVQTITNSLKPEVVENFHKLEVCSSCD
jgi:hypothetical protein